MAITDYISTPDFSAGLVDWTKLGGRYYITGGVTPNLVYDGNEENTRIVGAFPLKEDISLSEAGSGTALENGKQYIWAVRRKVTLGSMVLKSEYLLSSVHTATQNTDMELTFDLDYEYGPESGAVWTVEHTLYRSKGDATGTLYKVEDIADGTSTPYTDNTADGDLDTSDSISVANDDSHGWVPPCRTVTHFENRLIFGGSRDVASGTVSGSASSTTVTPSASALADVLYIGATLEIDNEPHRFSIESTDGTNWTVSPALENAHSATSHGGFRLYFPKNTIYVCNVLGGANAEAVQTPSYVLEQDENSGDDLRALAAHGSECYAFHEKSVKRLLEGTETWAVVGVPGVPGTPSHATVDDTNGPAVYWYAGDSGVWRMVGTEAQRISHPIDDVIATRVDHNYDEWAHGVYDPERQMYHLWLFEYGTVTDYGVQVPHLVLSYDVRNDAWYEGQLAASCSAVLPVDGQKRVVLGVTGGVVVWGDVAYDGYEQRLHWGDSDTQQIRTAGGTSANTRGMLFDTTDRPTGDDGAVETWVDFPITDGGLAGYPVHLVKYDADGNITSIQRRLVQSNNEDQIILWSGWDTAPASGDEIYIGAIDWELEVDDCNLLPRWNRLKNAVTDVEALFDVTDTQYFSRLWLQITGRRASNASVSQTYDLYDRDLLAIRGSDISGNARSVTLTLRGNTTKELALYGLRAKAGAAKKAR